MPRKLASIVLAAALFPLGAALASPAEGGWTLTDLPNGKMVYSTPEDGAGLAFGCSPDGTLSAFVNIDGADMANKLTDGIPASRSKPGKLSVDGGKAEKTKWRYMSDLQIMSPVQPKITRRLYNAAITGAPVQLELRYMDNVSIAPPKIDDAFKTFASSCKATSRA